MNKIKFPKKIGQRELENFFKKKGLNEIVRLSKLPDQKINEMLHSNPHKPELEDLYRLYQFVILNKRTTILEFGSGWSSLIFSLALNELKNKYNNKIKKLRRNNPFELFILENEKKFLDITKNRIKKFYNKKKLLNKIHYNYSEIIMTTYNGKFATEYRSLPLCNPDFIYLDGPGQFNIKGRVNGITTGHKDMMPMVCDLLKFEYFYTPGTIIITDGRGANAKFLKDNFKRNWIYKNDAKYDQHIFYLNDPSLGKYNNLQLKFYKGNI